MNPCSLAACATSCESTGCEGGKDAEEVKKIKQHMKTIRGPLAFDESGELRTIEWQRKLQLWKDTPQSQPPTPGMTTVEQFLLGKGAPARVDGDWLCEKCNVASCSVVNAPDCTTCYRCGVRGPVHAK
jgi:hypothetical protein